jgi:hypothetical protein
MTRSSRASRSPELRSGRRSELRRGNERAGQIGRPRARVPETDPVARAGELFNAPRVTGKERKVPPRFPPRRGEDAD